MRINGMDFIFFNKPYIIYAFNRPSWSTAHGVCTKIYAPIKGDFESFGKKTFSNNPYFVDI